MLTEIQIPATKSVDTTRQISRVPSATWTYLKCRAFAYWLVFTCRVTCRKEKSFDIFYRCVILAWVCTLPKHIWVNLKREVVIILGLLTAQASRMIFRRALKRVLSSSTDISGDCDADWQRKGDKGGSEWLAEVSPTRQQIQIKIYLLQFQTTWCRTWNLHEMHT